MFKEPKHKSKSLKILMDEKMFFYVLGKSLLEVVLLIVRGNMFLKCPIVKSYHLSSIQYKLHFIFIFAFV